MKKSISLNFRLMAMVGAMLLVIVGMLVATLTVNESQTRLTRVLDIAGRQRMLAQRYRAEITEISLAGLGAQGPTKTSGLADHELTGQLFEASLSALLDGGQAALDQSSHDQALQIQAAKAPPIRLALEAARDSWATLRSASVQVIEDSPESKTFGQTLARFEQAAAANLQDSENVVHLYKAKCDATVQRLIQVQYGAGLLGVVVSLIALSYIHRKVTRPLQDALTVANAVAAGDLTQSCLVSTSDEVGQLSDALNRMCTNLATLVSEIQSESADVSAASSTLFETSNNISSSAEQTNSQSIAVAAAAEEMSSNMSTMAQATERISTTFEAVSAATEELRNSIAGVANSASEAAAEAATANELVLVSNTRIHELSTAAEEIGNVIQTIQDIAEQTNLLALNATIEAARAGDAGKGFAVVATEVKALAEQTGGAIDDIRLRISGIQESATGTVASFQEVRGAIHAVDEVSRSIAAAVDEQRNTTEGIANQVQQTAIASREINAGVSESANASREITENISRLDQAARQGATSASDIRGAGEGISTLASRLDETVAKFKV